MRKLSKPLFICCVFILLSTLMVPPLFAVGVKVGVILPLTGKLAKFGEIEQKSFLMAAGEVNKAGGVNGNKIELIIEDTAGNPEVGLAAVEKLFLQDRVIVICGGCSSPVAHKVAEAAQQRQIPFLVNTAAADEITEQGNKYVFRLNTPASEYFGTLASFLLQVTRVKTTALIYEDSPFSRYGLKKFYKLIRKLDLRVVLKQAYEIDTYDFEPLLLKIQAKKPDLIYIISQVLDAASIVQQARDLDLQPKLFFGSTPGFLLSEFHEYAGDDSEHVYSVTIWTPSIPYSGAKAYGDKFAAIYNSSADYHGAQAYSAMHVIADALKRANSLTSNEVRLALTQTDMTTVLGPVKFISYGKKTQQNRLSTYLVQWINGRLEIVWPREVSTARYVYPARY